MDILFATFCIVWLTYAATILSYPVKAIIKHWRPVKIHDVSIYTDHLRNFSTVHRRYNDE